MAVAKLAALQAAGGGFTEASGLQGMHIFEVKASVVTKVQAKEFCLCSI